MADGTSGAEVSQIAMEEKLLEMYNRGARDGSRAVCASLLATFKHMSTMGITISNAQLLTILERFDIAIED